MKLLQSCGHGVGELVFFSVTVKALLAARQSSPALLKETLPKRAEYETLTGNWGSCVQVEPVPVIESTRTFAKPKILMGITLLAQFRFNFVLSSDLN